MSHGATEPSTPLEAGTLLDGKYRLRRPIGAGGMGAVWEADHEQLGGRVAIKVLAAALATSAEARGRFEREARILFRIQSPYVCRVFDMGALDDDRPFMAMELLEGDDLSALLEDRPQLPIREAVDLALQLCEAVTEAHAADIVHRDLKPENMFMTRGPRDELIIKLLDFGLSKERGAEAKRSPKLTETGQVMGTPHYMAPEQWISSSSVGPAADQWAIGAILFEMLTGRTAFEGKTIAELCGAILEGSPPSLLDHRSDAPPGLDVILRKCFERQSRHRYSSVGTLAMALSAFGCPGSVARAERLVQKLEGAEEDPSSFQFPSLGPRSSHMRVTERRIAARARSETAQSWQLLDEPAKGRARVALLGLTGLLAAGALAAMVSLGGPPETASSASEPTSAAQQRSLSDHREESSEPLTTHENTVIGGETDGGEAEPDDSEGTADADLTKADAPEGEEGEPQLEEPEPEEREDGENIATAPPPRGPRPQHHKSPPPPPEPPPSLFDERW